MNLKSLEGVLDGVGKLRAASIVAYVVNAGTLLSLNIPASIQGEGIIGASVLLAAVHVADGFIRGKHVSALPALIEQGAESVSKVQDPRVDAVASSVESIAARLAALEGAPKAPSVAEIISGLVGQGAAVQPVSVAPVASEGTPVPTPPVA